jgi:hypothetical protein
MARVLFFGAAWMGLLAALTATLGRPRASVTTDVRSVSVDGRHRRPRAGARFPGWTVTRAYSAHHMMVVEVEAERLDDGSKIAAAVVEPLKDRYDEVLIYLRNPGQRADNLAMRRIQWTPRAGYVESIYAPSARDAGR